MSRTDLGTANRGQAAASAIGWVFLLDIAFPSGTQRFATGDVNRDHLGQTYFANGTLLDVPGVDETIDLKARTVTFVLSAANPVLNAAIQAADWQWKEVNAWVGFVDESNAFVAVPYGHAPGLLASTAVLKEDTDTRYWEFDCETLLIYLQRSAAVLATDAGQKARAPGDTAFSRVAAVADQIIQWGGQSRAMGTSPGGFGIGNRFGRG